MHSRLTANLAICAALILGLASTALSQASGTQSELSALQRLDVMRSKIDGLRRSINSAVSSLPAKSANEKKNLDDPRERLRGMDKEAGSLSSEINEIRSKQERSDRYDPTILDRLEASVAELNTRVQAALQASASVRTDVGTSAAAPATKKKKGKFLGLFGGGGGEEYEELTGTVAPGRDRVLFVEAAKQVRKGNQETGRLLFATIINTYPDSPFLPLAKLAIADSFYLEGTTPALIQAAQGYLDWLTFFPTDPLADDAMLKVAESEMRQMGLSDRDVTHARKAEQRLKALLQQYPQTNLRPLVEDRLRESQEVLAMHGYQVGSFYLDARFKAQKGGLKGAQSRFKEVVDKYPAFSLRDEVLFKLAFTYQQEEEPDEAAKYYQEMLRNFPNSNYADKAKEQLGIIGVPIPEPDPARRNVAPAEHPGFVGNLMQQVMGKPDITVNNDGILIRKGSKEGVNDLIDEAIKYNGQLPSNVTPVAPVQRTTRQTPPNPAPRPASQNVIQPPPSSQATPAPREIKP
ncbi:MAG TPA: outer membrane protein assembly factor BamD [Pyrinomonadaceae bacterium]|jgi:outer membrane protein assembly factor BamD|nr:outer membrane protein assembly factor BamD [Pyrinomonadaceae bacterium]